MFYVIIAMQIIIGLDIRKYFVTKRVVKHRNRLSREVINAPNLSYFKSNLVNVLIYVLNICFNFWLKGPEVVQHLDQMITEGPFQLELLYSMAYYISHMVIWVFSVSNKVFYFTQTQRKSYFSYNYCFSVAIGSLNFLKFVDSLSLRIYFQWHKSSVDVENLLDPSSWSDEMSNSGQKIKGSLQIVGKIQKRKDICGY